MLALIGYLSKGHWRFDPFEHWLVLALIVDFVGQGLFMASSTHMGDTMFTAAHVLKILSYGCAFTGLLANMRFLYSESLARQELALKNIILTTQQETSQDAILVVGGDNRIISYNRRFIELWALPEALVRRRDDRPVLAFVGAQVKDEQAFVRRIRYLYEHRSEQSFEEVLLKNGRILDRYSAPMIGADGIYYGRVWYFRDITEKKHNEQAIRESEEKFRGLVDQSLVGIALIEDGWFTYVNQKFAAIFGYEFHEMARMGVVDIASDKDKEVVREALRRQLHPHGEGDEFTFQGVRKGGVLIEVEGRSARMHVSGKLVLMVIVLDITGRVQAEREVQLLQSRLRDQAIRDPLTGLYNRRYLAEALKDELARAARGGYPVSLVIGDIDHFKAINDTYGHLAGDGVLRAFSTLLKTYSRASDIGCRYGGEEFLIVLPGMAKAQAVERTEALRTGFAAEPMSHDAFTIRATVSFGVAAFPEDGVDVDALIAVADEALYAAKRSGRNRVVAGRAEKGEEVAD
ncbi:MAG TPA: diguanylate cyclase, partial [Gammaproteobacteria bacterium]|nr:diguanylate cyclase [Gammaproteobacteria bacterium]